MASKKWFGLAAVAAAIGGAVAYLVTKVKESPDKAAEMFETAKEKAKESPEKAAALIDTAKDKVKRNGEDAESDEAGQGSEKETAAS